MCGSVPPIPPPSDEGYKEALQFAREQYEFLKQQRMPYYYAGGAALDKLMALGGLRPHLVGIQGGDAGGGGAIGAVARGGAGAVGRGGDAARMMAARGSDAGYGGGAQMPIGAPPPMRAGVPGTRSAYGANAGPMDAMGGPPVQGGIPVPGDPDDPEGILKALRDTPGYQFAFEQGQRAIQNSAASRGTLLTGGTLKALERFGTGLADQTYDNAWRRYLSLADLGGRIVGTNF